MYEEKIQEKMHGQGVGTTYASASEYPVGYERTTGWRNNFSGEEVRGGSCCSQLAITSLIAAWEA